MFKNYLKITFRSFAKNKVFVFVNILGLGVAIGCCIVAYLNYDFNINFDREQKNTESIYRIGFHREYNGESVKYGMAPMPLGNAVAQNIGDVESVMRYMPSNGNFRINDDLFSTNFTFVDDTFFEFFDFNLLSGTKKDLQDKSSIFISSEVVKKYFGDLDPVGQMLTHLTTDKGTKDYTVKGVFEKLPLNSSFGNIETITHINNGFDVSSNENHENDWASWSTLFVKIDDASRIPVIEEQLKNYIEIQNQARIDFKITNYFIEPFEGMAHRAANDEINGHWLRSSMPPPAVVVPSIMAILILLIACFNFTNTSIAISSKRLKEIGLRKVMGGQRQQLILQFMTENILLCFFSLVIGLIVAAFLVPAYSEMWQFVELKMSFTNNVGFFIFLIGLLLVTGLVAGSYPAFYISKYEPASILKGTTKLGGTSRLTSSLLTLQFTISLLAIIMGVLFYQNAKYQEELDFGFDKEGVITLYLNNEDEYRAFENLINQDLRIKSIAASEHQINRSYRNDPVISGDKEYETDILHIGEQYLETMGFSLLEGRNFRKDSETDFKESAIVSESMVRLFGWDNPIGQKLVWMDTTQLYVIGVVKDAYLSGLWDPIEPLMLRYIPPKEYRFMTVKTSPADLIAVNEFMEAQWKTLYPERMYFGSYMDEDMSQAAEINENILKLFGFIGVVATLLSAIGLFSMVSLNILKRMKEIGVRKVLGASVPGIVGVLNKNFVVILLIASILGSAISYFIADMLMASIWEYHIAPNISAFLVSTLLLFLIASVTVGTKVYRAATANPVTTLRSE